MNFGLSTERVLALMAYVSFGAATLGVVGETFFARSARFNELGDLSRILSSTRQRLDVAYISFGNLLLTASLIGRLSSGSFGGLKSLPWVLDIILLVYFAAVLALLVFNLFTQQETSRRFALRATILGTAIVIIQVLSMLLGGR